MAEIASFDKIEEICQSIVDKAEQVYDEIIDSSVELKHYKLNRVGKEFRFYMKDEHGYGPCRMEEIEPEVYEKTNENKKYTGIEVKVEDDENDKKPVIRTFFSRRF